MLGRISDITQRNVDLFSHFEVDRIDQIGFDGRSVLIRVCAITICSCWKFCFQSSVLSLSEYIGEE